MLLVVFMVTSLSPDEFIVCSDASVLLDIAREEIYSPIMTAVPGGVALCTSDFGKAKASLNEVMMDDENDRRNGENGLHVLQRLLGCYEKATW